jgi:hypothetical protein
MREVEVYENVPDGSTLELGMTADDPADEGNFTGHVLLITSFEPDQNWEDGEIHPGPRLHELTSPRAYMLEIRAAFQAAADVTVTARIVKPDGEVYSTPKEWELQGDNGDQELRILFIRTAQ